MSIFFILPRPIRYFIVFATVILNCLFINLLQLPFLILKPLIPRPLFKRISKFTQKAFTELLLLLIYLFAPTEYVLSGDFLNEWKKEGCLLICNHQTYGDWIYIWVLAYLLDSDDLMKIVLKASLKKVPIVGWGMQTFEFIFLDRNWSSDQKTLYQALSQIKKDSEPICLLLFPEGTVINDKTRKKSIQYAIRHNLLPSAEPKFVLLPRSTGLEFCLRHLCEKESKNVRAVYDLTMGYTGVKVGDVPEKVFTLRKIFIDGLSPKQIHFNLRRYEISDFISHLQPKSESENDFDEHSETKKLFYSRNGLDSGLSLSVDSLDMDLSEPVKPLNPFALFLIDLFHKKDQLMKTFYETGRFHEHQITVPLGYKEWIPQKNILGREKKNGDYILFKIWLFYFILFGMLMFIHFFYEEFEF